MGGDNDVFQGRNGSTVAGMVDGGDGNDSLTGGDGGDVLLGGVGNDTVKGGAGGDELSGGEGHDLLNGGQGNDTLSGGAGNDTMLGGAGEDVFVWAPGFGVDRIGDFGAGDQLDLSGFDFADGQAVIDAMFQQGGNVVLRIMDGEKLTLQNVQLADLDPNQFIVEGALLI
jgi:Ca2+-binding RTX toxin-like protein